MPLQFVDERDEYISYKNVGYENDRQAFRLDPESGNGQSFFVPVVQPLQNRVPLEDYLVYLLARPDPAENDIYELREGRNRIGMIFPLQVLKSTDHAKADDGPFLSFSDAALNALCTGNVNGFIKKPRLSTQEIIEITEFYSSDTVVCVIYKERLNTAEAFKIEDYIISLFRYGYSLQTADRDPTLLFRPEIPNLYKTAGIPIVKIEKSVSMLEADPFVRRALQTLLPYEQDPLLTFFYLYQLIELLLDRVLQIEYKSFMADVSANGANNDLKDVITDLQSRLSEKKRLAKIFSIHLRNTPDLQALKGICNNFLKVVSVDYKEKEDFAGFLYPVRNKLFHDLRSLPDNGMSMVVDICAELKIVVCELLFNFHDSSSVDVNGSV